MTGSGPGLGADAVLVREVAAGSHDALAELYDRHADAIFAAASRLTSDRGLAEEVVQETFLALWNRAGTFDPSIGFFWKADHQQIYRELSRLRDRGHIQGREVVQSGKPNKLVYTLTSDRKSVV